MGAESRERLPLELTARTFEARRAFTDAKQKSTATRNPWVLHRIEPRPAA
jgi:hypothetical protein